MKQTLLILFALLVTACAPTIKMEQHQGEIQMADATLPRKVAVLPFVNGTEEPGVEALVRRNFANHLSSKSYLDTKLSVVDEKLVHFEKSSGKSLEQATPREISAAVGSDGLLYGKVTEFKKVWAGVYSQLGVEAEVWMVNAATGKELFRLKEAVRYHEGGVPTSPLSVVVTAVSTAMNLRDIQKVRMINELCFKFMERFPSPKTLAADSRPVIKDVLSNASEGPFGPRRLIKVGLEGEPGLVASFDLGNFRKGIPMKELKPGIYGGEYAVLPGDNTKDMPVTVTLTRSGGYETEWVDLTGYVTIDTTPPPPVAAVKTRSYRDRIELRWDPLKSVPDLKGYRVLRSESPLSGYRELAAVEVPTYSDSSAVAGKSYYYRVVPFDLVGNEAEPADGTRAALVAAEPQELAGELKGDTALEGSYLVTAPVMVPKGITLTISGDSRLAFAPGTGLQMRGRLVVKGGATSVEFVPAGEGKWGGIALEGGRGNLAHFTLRGAVTGIAGKDSEATLEGGVITGCDTGLAVSGMLPFEIKGMTLSGNGIGLRLNGTAAKVTDSNVLQNKDGIFAEAFSGEIRNNNIMDNGRNIHAEKLMEVGPNWFGTVQAESLKLSNVSVGKVYDGRVPGGVVVAPVVNPYALLTAEERKKKGAEFLVEGGNYFRQRNFGKASVLFNENLQLSPSAETYYYLSICHQEMKEQDKALKLLQEGTQKFPKDPLLWKSLGMIFYEKNDDSLAAKALEEALRLSPDDRQARFVLERLQKKP